MTSNKLNKLLHHWLIQLKELTEVSDSL